MQLSPSSPFIAKLLINSRLQSVFPFHFLPVISPQGLTFLQASTLHKEWLLLRSAAACITDAVGLVSLHWTPGLGVLPAMDDSFLQTLFSCCSTRHNPHSCLPLAFLCWLVPIYLTCKCWNSSSCVSLYQSSSLSKCPLHSPGSHCHLCADDPQTETKTLLWCPLLPWAVYPDSSSECLTLPSTAI